MYILGAALFAIGVYVMSTIEDNWETKDENKTIFKILLSLSFLGVGTFLIIDIFK